MRESTEAIKETPSSAVRLKTTVLGLVFGLSSVGVLALLLLGHQGEIGALLIANTIRVSLFWYFISIFSMLRLSPLGWKAQTMGGQLARWCWLWGMIVFWLHLMASMHFFHAWSFQHAYHHVQQQSGFGPGIFISYLFTLVWTADVWWWWIKPDGYGQRPAWVGRLVHGFLLFIIFNGTVVFEQGPVQIVAGLAFVGLALLLGWTRWPGKAGQ